MARTPSNTDLPLGSPCPAFELPNVLTGSALSRDDIYAGPADPAERRGLLVAFLCVHCPFVQHMQLALTAVLRDFNASLAAVAIMSNDLATNPEDSPDHMRRQAQHLGWPDLGIPYLLDNSQETAREFRAACTPDLYLFNADRELTYHGQLDRTRPYRSSDLARGVPHDPLIHIDAHGEDLRNAIAALLADQPPITPQLPGLGCNIKWREA